MHFFLVALRVKFRIPMEPCHVTKNSFLVICIKGRLNLAGSVNAASYKIESFYKRLVIMYAYDQKIKYE